MFGDFCFDGNAWLSGFIDAVALVPVFPWCLHRAAVLVPRVCLYVLAVIDANMLLVCVGFLFLFVLFF